MAYHTTANGEIYIEQNGVDVLLFQDTVAAILNEKDARIAELEQASKRAKDAESVVIYAAKLLQEIEWVYHADYREHQCEICLEYKATGHRADCALKRFIDKYAK